MDTNKDELAGLADQLAYEQQDRGRWIQDGDIWIYIPAAGVGQISRIDYKRTNR